MQTVLVVDDDDFMRMMLEEALCENFRVIAAASGEQALRLATEVSLDAILLDVEMPEGIDGYETCRRLKTIRAVAGVPVIFVSGHEEEVAGREGIAAGGAGYIVKPFDPQDLMALVEKVLGVS